MKCLIGGTFSILHAGHEKLLRAALAFDEIVIGLTSDAFVKRKKQAPLIQYVVRKRNLALFLARLAKKKPNLKIKFMKIEDEFGPALTENADALIVSAETKKTAEMINEARLANSRKPLKIIPLPLAYASDYLKISSSRIFQKKIDEKGRRLAPVILALGTLNPSKKQGLENAAKKLFGNFRIEMLKVQSGVSNQPFEQETVQGAENRARAAYYATDADYGIGFESGIFRMGENLHDIALCAIFDGEKTTFGNSMGFQMPARTIDLLAQHKDLGAVMEKLSGIKKIGYKQGAIHYLSAGLLSRQEMNEQAFLCAMIPRISEAKGIFSYD